MTAVTFRHFLFCTVLHLPTVAADAISHEEEFCGLSAQEEAQVTFILGMRLGAITLVTPNAQATDVTFATDGAILRTANCAGFECILDNIIQPELWNAETNSLT